MASFLEELFKNAQQSYPTSESIGQRMGQRNMDYFQPQQSQLAQMAPQQEMQGPMLPGMQPSALSQMAPQEQMSGQVPQQPQSSVEQPYNMAERIFLGLGGQGEAVKKDKQRYALAQLVESMPAESKNPSVGALREAAMRDPNQFGEAYLKMAMGGGVDTKGEGDLRKEVDGITKDYRTINDAYSRVKASAVNPSAAGDLALIFNYMKILDPGSTVREGEFATAQNSGSIPDRIRAQYNKTIAGERLAPEMRTDFVDRAGKLWQAQAENYNQVATQYRGIADQYGYEKDRIIRPVEFPKELQKPLAPTATREQKIKRLEELKALKAGKK